MKKIIVVLVAGLMVVAGAHAQGGGTASPYWSNVSPVSNLDAQQTQIMQGQGYAEGGNAIAQGGNADSSSGAVAVTGDATSDSSSGAVALSGDATSGSSSGAVANISTTSISNYQTRTPPLSVLPPYLPYWQHGGWGTLKAYFPNGPSDDQVYERTFDPDDSCQMRELRGVLQSLSYDGPVKALGGILNGVCTIFGGPDNFHHGRGFEIASSLIREHRHKGEPLVVFIDSNVDRKLLKEAGYAYVGKVSIEGNVDRNWDHVYDAAVAEALLWDVDILLISGGMKGVSIGSSQSFPGAGFGYSQTNYSISLFGSSSSGITEGKGKAILSAEGYRFWPGAAIKRQVPQFLYDQIRVSAVPRQQDGSPAAQAVPAQATTTTTQASAAAAKAPAAAAKAPVAAKATPTEKVQQPALRKENAQGTQGVQVSRQLYEMAGFQEGQRVENLIIR